MRTHYAGIGRLLQAGWTVDEVGYDFEVNADHSLTGGVWSNDQSLPQGKTLLLQLEDLKHFAAVSLSTGIHDRRRMQYHYSLAAAIDQPDDPNNLVLHAPGKRP